MICRRDFFAAQGMKAECVTNSTTGRYHINFNSALLHATENSFAGTIFMIAKIGQYMKASNLIVHKLLSDVRAVIEKFSVVNAGGMAQQSLDTHYSMSSEICSQVYPNFLEEENTCLSIDNDPLVPTTRKIMSSCVTGFFLYCCTREVLRC